MAFCFKKKEPVAKAIRRLGCERIEGALECLKDCGRAEAIHGARKDIKKTRAVLRMVRANTGKKEFRRLTNWLRDAASGLAAPRDAYVKLMTLRDLTRRGKGQFVPGALRSVRLELRNAFDEAMKRLGKEKATRAVERMLRRVADELEHLEVSGKGWNALSPGVKTAYSQGRCAYQTALKDSSPENFHEWRKRAKDLWYQVSLLRPVWPEQMDAMASELEELGEQLGADHDLVVLRQTIEERHARVGESREWETLQGLIEQRQRELRGTATALGARFYAEEPAAFCERLAGYWRTWRREKKSVSQFVEAASK